MMDDYLVYNPYTHEQKVKNLSEIPKYFGVKMNQILDQLSEGEYYFDHPDLYLLPEDIPRLDLKDIYVNHPHDGEAWRQLDDKYSVSNHGRVIKHQKTKDFMMTPYKKKHMYQPSIMVKFHGKEVKVARLVMQAFHDELIEELCVSHVDHNIWNNYYENLRALTKEKHGKITGCTANNSYPVELINDDGEVIEWYRSVREAAKHNFISHQAILEYLKGKTRSAAGMKFRRVYESR